MSVRFSVMRALARVSLSGSAPRTALSAARPTAAVTSRVYKHQPIGMRTFGDESQNSAGQESTMFLTNLEYGLTNEEILKEVGQLGEIENVSRVNRGSCRIQFKDANVMHEAIEKINGSFWRGRRVFAAQSRPAVNARTDNMEPTCTLYIGNIPSNATDLELSEVLSGVSSIPFLRLLRDNQTGAFRGFGYADFYSIEDATRAKEKLDGRSIRGNTLRINFAPTTRQALEAIERRKKMLGLATENGVHTFDESTS